LARLDRRAEAHVVADRKNLLDLQRGACPELLGPGVVVVQAQAKLADQVVKIRFIGPMLLFRASSRSVGSIRSLSRTSKRCGDFAGDQSGKKSGE
jgi:hypothetical protein